jgi:tRNA-modifying protein YgfZ
MMMMSASPDMRIAHELETKAAYRLQPETSVLSVRGDDRVTWLNGQLTNDVRSIPAGDSVHALAVNVKGKIMAEVWVSELREREQLLMLVPRRAEAALRESLEHFIIMEDVTLEPQPELQVLSIEGPDARRVQAELAADGCSFGYDPLKLGGVAYIGTSAELDLVVQKLEAAGVPRISPEAYELARLRQARPRYGVDFDEHHYPQEAGLKAYVSFQKGCYLGQEVVCTLENRGRLSRHLCELRGAPDQRFEPGTPLSIVKADGSSEATGAFTSVVWDPELNATRALGYVRRVHAQPGLEVMAGTHALTLVKLVGEDTTDAPASAP